jgi:hypothetical protein
MGEAPMFAESIRALEVFAADATGWPTRVGAALGDLPAKAGETSGGGTSAQSRIRAASPDQVISLHLVSVTRNDRLRNADREVGGGSSSGTAGIRRPPGWFDLTVALEAGGDEVSAAEAIERILSATLYAGNLAETLQIAGDYPVYASIDTPSLEELQTWWQNGLTRSAGAALRAVVTVAVQPFETAQVGIVQHRRIHVEDKRTHIRETVER